MLTNRDEIKMNKLLNKLFHLYAFISVVLQMEMPYSASKPTKAFLGVIANRVEGLDHKIVQILKNAKRLDYYDEEHESEESYLARRLFLKELNREYSDMRGACGLIGIKIKSTYSVHDAIAFANKV